MGAGFNWWRLALLGRTRIRIARIGRKIAKDVERRFPEDPVGPFWAASYAGLEGLARGVLDALYLVPDNLVRLERIDKDFPEYFYGGATLLLGKGYIKDSPFPLSIGNLAKGVHDLEKARPYQEGRIAMRYLFFAEAIYLRTGDADRAIAVLDRIETDVRPIDAAGRYALETARVDAASFRRVLREGPLQQIHLGSAADPVAFLNQVERLSAMALCSASPVSANVVDVECWCFGLAQAGCDRGKRPR